MHRFTASPCCKSYIFKGQKSEHQLLKSTRRRRRRRGSTVGVWEAEDEKENGEEGKGIRQTGEGKLRDNQYDG